MLIAFKILLLFVILISFVCTFDSKHRESSTVVFVVSTLSIVAVTVL